MSPPTGGGPQGLQKVGGAVTIGLPYVECYNKFEKEAPVAVGVNYLKSASSRRMGDKLDKF